MSTSWEQSRAAERLRAAGQLEVAAPPPLAKVKSEAGRRARRAAAVMAFAVAIPVGAAAAAGGFVMTKKAAPVVAPRIERKVETPRVVKPVEPVETPLVVEPPPVAPAPVAVKRSAVASRVASPSVVTPEVPAVGSPLTPALSPRGEREVVVRTSLADESRALAAALTALRVQRDAARALELLAAYRERFPAGALRSEAALATVEAHRSLGHVAEALAALDDAPRRPDLDVLRAELNAQAGDCEAARAIARELRVEGALRERAVFTDATCALTLGARDEAVQLLQQLPDSARARELLEKLK